MPAPTRPSTRRSTAAATGSPSTRDSSRRTEAGASATRRVAANRTASSSRSARRGQPVGTAATATSLTSPSTQSKQRRLLRRRRNSQEHRRRPHLEDRVRPKATRRLHAHRHRPDPAGIDLHDRARGLGSHHDLQVDRCGQDVAGDRRRLEPPALLLRRQPGRARSRLQSPRRSTQPSATLPS